MKANTNELTGPALDWAVAKCEGWAEYGDLSLDSIARNTLAYNDWGRFEPSEDWAQGGPIIERQEIELTRWALDGWKARDTNYQFLNTPQERDVFAEGYGSTPLIAAMRCYVASKLGDQIDIPEHLLC